MQNDLCACMHAPTHTHQLWDVPDTERDLDETPVTPDTDVVTAVVVRIAQTDQHLRAKTWDYTQSKQTKTQITAVS